MLVSLYNLQCRNNTIDCANFFIKGVNHKKTWNPTVVVYILCYIKYVKVSLSLSSSQTKPNYIHVLTMLRGC